jgi:hypothetical protein
MMSKERSSAPGKGRLRVRLGRRDAGRQPHRDDDVGAHVRHGARRDRVEDPAVRDGVAADAECREDAGDRHAGEEREPDEAAAEQDLALCLEIRGDDGQRDRQILDPHVADLVAEEARERPARQEPPRRDRRVEDGGPRPVEHLGRLHRGHPERVRRGGQRAHARAGDDVDRDAEAPQLFEGAEVRVPLQAPRAERNADPQVDEVARDGSHGPAGRRREGQHAGPEAVDVRRSERRHVDDVRTTDRAEGGPPAQGGRSLGGRRTVGRKLEDALGVRVDRVCVARQDEDVGVRRAQILDAPDVGASPQGIDRGRAQQMRAGLRGRCPAAREPAELVPRIADRDEEGRGSRVPGDARGERPREFDGPAPVDQNADVPGCVPRGEPVGAREALREDGAEIPVDDGIGGRDGLEVDIAHDQRVEVGRRAHSARRGLPREERHLAEG